jgi:hypothetical protein
MGLLSWSLLLLLHKLYWFLFCTCCFSLFIFTLDNSAIGLFVVEFSHKQIGLVLSFVSSNGHWKYSYASEHLKFSTLHKRRYRLHGLFLTELNLDSIFHSSPLEMLVSELLFGISRMLLHKLSKPKSKSRYDWRSSSQYVGVWNPLWDLWPDTTNVASWTRWVKAANAVCRDAGVFGIKLSLQYDGFNAIAGSLMLCKGN